MRRLLLLACITLLAACKPDTATPPVAGDVATTAPASVDPVAELSLVDAQAKLASGALTLEGARRRPTSTGSRRSTRPARR